VGFKTTSRLGAVAALAVALLSVAPATSYARAWISTAMADSHAQVSTVPADIGTLIAPVQACPGQNRLDTSAEGQIRAMECMTNFARSNAGLGELTYAAALEESAGYKGDDILRCDSFSHFACDRQFTYWIQESGYLAAPCWHVGENLAWGVGEYSTVRSIFRAWMRSPEHRRNILGEYSQIGINLRIGELEGRGGAHVWIQHFGSHCENTAASETPPTTQS
jgi:uncharacterized protein YkwD